MAPKAVLLLATMYTFCNGKLSGNPGVLHSLNPRSSMRQRSMKAKKFPRDSSIKMKEGLGLARIRENLILCILCVNKHAAQHFTSRMCWTTIPYLRDFGSHSFYWLAVLGCKRCASTPGCSGSGRPAPFDISRQNLTTKLLSVCLSKTQNFEIMPGVAAARHA
jgi:hypothetical protein